MNTDPATLRSRMKRATDQLHKANPVAAGGAGDEAEYASAYDALSKAGMAPPLRRKYR